MPESEAIVVAPSEHFELDTDAVRLLADAMRTSGLSKQEFLLFVKYVQRSGLDPFIRQIYAIKSQGRMNVIVGIDGLRVIAQRTGLMDGIETLYKAKDGPWLDYWDDDEPPHAVKVTVYRKGSSRGFSTICRYDSFVKDTPTWKSMPEHMLAIRAEAHSLRKAFPAETSAYHAREVDVLPSDEDAPVQSSVTVQMPTNPMSDDQRALLFALAGELGLDDDGRHALTEGLSWSKLTRQQAHDLAELMRDTLESRQAEANSSDPPALGDGAAATDHARPDEDSDPGITSTVDATGGSDEGETGGAVAQAAAVPPAEPDPIPAPEDLYALLSILGKTPAQLRLPAKPEDMTDVQRVKWYEHLERRVQGQERRP